MLSRDSRNADKIGTIGRVTCVTSSGAIAQARAVRKVIKRSGIHVSTKPRDYKTMGILKTRRYWCGCKKRSCRFSLFTPVT